MAASVPGTLTISLDTFVLENIGSLIENVNALMGKFQSDQDYSRYMELLSIMNYRTALNPYRNRMEVGAIAVLNHVDMKYPDLYGFLQNPKKYGIVQKSLVPIGMGTNKSKVF